MCDGASDRCCCGKWQEEHSHATDCSPEQVEECHGHDHHHHHHHHDEDQAEKSDD